MKYDELEKQVQHYVLSFFNANVKPALYYHNHIHTENVVAAARQIANHYQLPDEEIFIVLAAAWFHDIGYLEGVEGHEERGAEAAETFLKSSGVSDEVIQGVKNCILATKANQKPIDLPEQIVCDADMFHLGTPDFSERSKLMRKEFEAVQHTPISKGDWRRKNIALLQKHRYYTEYCRLLLNPGKQKNLEKLQAKEAGEDYEDTPGVSFPDTVVQQEKIQSVPEHKEYKQVKDKKDRPDRGIETMFRITSNNHQRLSDMADNKANIMITVNSIILSVLISVLLRKLEDSPALAIPAVLLVSVNLVTIIFAALATRPSLPKGVFGKNDVAKKQVNLLFFGNFYKMGLEDYTDGVLQMMDDREFLYRSLIKDVYSQGIVLGHKYRLLRIAYNIFMFGIVISVIGFIIASIYGRVFHKLF